VSSAETIHKNVQQYYGETLSTNADLQTTACCVPDAIPKQHKEILAKIHDDILSKFYGCGSPLPAALDGCTILDLGCGTGRDVFLAAALAGPESHVIGIDMTDEQLEVARRHHKPQCAALGIPASTVEFRKGIIEDLAASDIADNSVDVVISNCVINLASCKETVFREIFRVLKPGGELYFSDVYADRRIPQALIDDPILHGECLGGALYDEDFRRILSRLGCPDSRVVSSSPIAMTNPAVEALTGDIQFFSRTIRAFKLASLEDRCEDFGQAARYKGDISNSPHGVELDDHHYFCKGKFELVCGNTAAMLQETRFGPYFEIVGDHSTHYGIFGGCGETIITEADLGGDGGGCC